MIEAETGGGAAPARSGSGFGATKPVDIATHVYLAAISILIILFALEACWLNLLGAAATSVALIGIQVGSRRWSEMTRAIVRTIFYTALILVFYFQLKALIPEIHPQPFGEIDAALRTIDRAIFGVDPTRALEPVVNPLATEILQIAYMAYYPLPLVLPIILLWRRDLLGLEKFALALLLVFYITYLGYISVPANGPGMTMTHDVELTGLLLGERLYDWIREVDAYRYDCYPSGHTAVAVMVAWYAWRLRLGALAWTLSVVAVGIILSTVYMRYHYVIDLPAGVLVAVGSVGIAEWVYRGRREAPAPTSPS